MYEIYAEFALYSLKEIFKYLQMEINYILFVWKSPKEETTILNLLVFFNLGLCVEMQNAVLHKFLILFIPVKG